MDSLKVDLNLAKEQAGKIRTAKDRLTRWIREDYERILRNLQAGWDSESSRELIRKLLENEEKLERISGRLGQAEAVLEETCQTMRKAEERTEEIANEDGYGQPE